MEIFVGNLSFAAAEDDVKKLFEGYGLVAAVTVLMREEKKVPKSRGFGFVQMPDEQQALAAIAALNGKEFMERVINVEPARPKTETRAEDELKEKKQPEEKKPWLAPVFKKPERPGTYRSGRRTNSYVRRQRLAGLPEEAKPRKRSEDNPMRWRKKRPWQKSPGEHKPWQKTEGEARPWKKPAGDAKPWRKSEGGVKPWQKNRGEHKPWQKSPGEHKPWQKTEGEARPWKKPAGDAKPWTKSNRRAPKSGFNPSASLGMVRGSGERPSTSLRTALSERSESNGRSRTKSRRRPGT
jgi:hypothetical protein